MQDVEVADARRTPPRRTAARRPSPAAPTPCRLVARRSAARTLAASSPRRPPHAASTHAAPPQAASPARRLDARRPSSLTYSADRRLQRDPSPPLPAAIIADCQRGPSPPPPVRAKLIAYSFRPPGQSAFGGPDASFAEFDQIYNNAGATFGPVGPALDGPPQRVLSGVLHSFLSSGRAGVPFQPVPIPALGLSEGDKQCIRDRSCIMAHHILADQPEEYIQAQVNTLLHSLDIDNSYRTKNPLHGPYPEMEEYWNQSLSALRSGPMHNAAHNWAAEFGKQNNNPEGWVTEFGKQNNNPEGWITEFGKKNNNPEGWARSFEQQYGPNGWASEFEQVRAL
nr:peroxisome biogenesis protein 5-like [Lolium perenne]